MNIEQLREFCLSRNQATEGFPFPSLPNVLVFKVGGKMFAGTDISTFASIGIKHDPETIDDLRAKYNAITNHTYFSSKHWSKIWMDNTIPDAVLFELIDTSYKLTVNKLTRKIKQELGL